MTKRRIIFVLVACASMAVFAVQTLSQTGDLNQTAEPSDVKPQRNMTETEMKREIDRRLKKEKLEHERRQRESKKRFAEQKKQWESGADERKKKEEEWEKEVQEAGGMRFINAKYALSGLGVTEEQWKLIKPKLEKARKQQNLCESEHSTSGLFLGSSTGSGISSTGAKQPGEPRWLWKRPWKERPPAELSEGQKIAEAIIRLLDKKNATPEQFKQKMDALRKARIAEEPEEQRREKEFKEAKQELREGLTTRQEAVLVLMGWL